MTSRNAKIILISALILYCAVLGAVSVMRHYNFQTQTWDLGAFMQTFWNTLQGRVMQNNLEEAPNHLGVHMSPFLFLLVPGYAIFSSPYFLLIVQTIALALGAIPLFYLGLRVLKNRTWALTLAIGYLLYPSLHWVNLFDFHEISFLPPLLLAFFYFAQDRRWGWTIFFAILAAATKEDAILVVAFAGIFLWLKDALYDWRGGRAFWKNWSKEKRIGMGIAIASILYFIISIKVLMPLLGGGLLRLDRYADLGGSFGGILSAIFSEPGKVFGLIFDADKISYLFWVFLPVAFLPLFSGVTLVLLVPGLAENLLTSYKFQFTSFYQYDAVLIAGIFVSAVFGARFLLSRFPQKERILHFVLVFALGLVFFLRSPVSPISFPSELFGSNPHWEMFRKMVELTPPGVSVAAHTNLVPHLSEREHSYMLGYEPFMTDAVLIDGADLFGFADEEHFRSHVERYASSPDYVAYPLDERYVIVLKKGLKLATPAKPKQ